MKIVLIGFMGSGKTTVAQSLAKNFNLDFIDMDDLALKKTTRKSINEIFEKDGEKKFRDIEYKVGQELELKNNVVISTGGGVVMNDSLMAYLRNKAVVIYLKSSFDKIKERIVLKKMTPPLFQNVESAKKLYDLREPLYIQYADFVVETDDKNVKDLVKEIMEAVNGRQ